MSQAGDGLVSAGQNKKLTSSQLRVLGFIAACGMQGCSETKRAIAEKLSLSIKTVDRAIHRLREDALIVSEARFGENGTQLSLSPERVEGLLDAVREKTELAEAGGRPAVLVCAPAIRPALRRLVALAVPRLPVLSYTEVSGTRMTIETVGVVGVRHVIAA